MNRYKSLLLAVASTAYLANMWGCTTNKELDTSRASVDQFGLKDDTSGEEDNFALNWDTGFLDTDPPCNYMDKFKCFELNGKFDISTLERRCVDGMTEKCCLEDTMTNSCPHECVYGAANCQNRNGTVHSKWSTGHEYECSEYFDVCCEGPDPVDTTIAQDDGIRFNPADCTPTTCPNVADPIATSEQQPDKLASGICMEMKDINSPWFCPQEDYDRIVRDIDTIKETYLSEMPWCLLNSHVHNAFDSGLEPHTIMCVPGVKLTPKSCTDFPKEEWEELADSFGISTVRCLFGNEASQTCGQIHLKFDVGANTTRMLKTFEDHAKSFVSGSVCELNAYVGVTLPREGYHPRDKGNGVWQWAVRVTAQHELSLTHCDLRITVETSKESSALDVIEIDNQSDHLCESAGYDIQSWP